MRLLGALGGLLGEHPPPPPLRPQVNLTGAFAVVQMVVHDLDSGNLTAVSDHRKGGAPAGY